MCSSVSFFFTSLLLNCFLFAVTILSETKNPFYIGSKRLSFSFLDSVTVVFFARKRFSASTFLDTFSFELLHLFGATIFLKQKSLLHG